MNTTETAAFTAAINLMGLQFTNTVGEPDASDALAHIEDGEALVRIFDALLMTWAREAASSLPGNFRDGIKELTGTLSTALHESDFMCELRAVHSAMSESRPHCDASFSQRTHAGTV